MTTEPVPATWVGADFDPLVRQAVQRIVRAPGVCRVVVLPDAHPAPGICNGLAVATRDWLYPQAVGADIGCGYATVPLELSADAVRAGPRGRAALAAMRTAVPIRRFARGLSRAPFGDELDARALSNPGLRRAARRDGWLELGTLGSGNHFLEIQADDDGRLWLLVHSGSRAVGQAVTRLHLEVAEPVGQGLAGLPVESEAADSYLSDLAWARAYAAESRRRMLAAAVEALGRRCTVRADWSGLRESDHNHVQRERHGEDWLWVHRKGANQADRAQANVIPGSMGTFSVHVVGRGWAGSLCSSSHGAGRRVRRRDARRVLRSGEVARSLADVVHACRGAGLHEEAPQAYKDLAAVLRWQRAAIRVVRRLRPLVVHKGR